MANWRMCDIHTHKVCDIEKLKYIWLVPEVQNVLTCVTWEVIVINIQPTTNNQQEKGCILITPRK